MGCQKLRAPIELSIKRVSRGDFRFVGLTGNPPQKDRKDVILPPAACTYTYVSQIPIMVVKYG
jgi:hypothetical protein